MEKQKSLEERLEVVEGAWESEQRYLRRFIHQARFAMQLMAAKPEHREAWEPLIEKAVTLVENSLQKRPIDVKSAVEEAERVLAPIGKVAKEYTIHCVGHAHIDMNWMWTWPETVAVINDTFTTVDRLMDEFPEFKFSQSQVSTYLVLKEYFPELFERVRARVKEGRWEITASTWVEGDKNLASGEIMCRHLLYTKRLLSKLFDIPVDAVRIDWEPDLFGHAHTVPTVLARAGVKRYYFCRCGKGHRLFWWQGPDGSRVLSFDDGVLGYNGAITPDVSRLLLDFERATGIKEYLFVYGVGDHGGGPTRQDLAAALEMDSWPIFPKLKFSTTEEYFSTIEPKLPDDLPVVDDELNFTFRGCYTSQSNIKKANRYSENRLIEAEIIGVIASKVLGMPYPSEDLFIAWRNAMFNQFHDILPGSGVHGTYEYAQGLFQEILARTGAIRARGLRSLAAKVDTMGMGGASGLGPGTGAGAGDESALGRVSTLSGGGVSAEPFLVFNPNPWERDDVVTAKIWDRDIPEDMVAVRTPQGGEFAGQVVGKGKYWGHEFVTVVFPVEKLPPVGYRIYSVSRSYSPLIPPEGVRADDNVMENQFLRVEIDQESGAVSSLFDKRTGHEFVPEGKRLGLLEWLLEAPHGMTAWEIGQIVERMNLTQGATTEVIHKGPYLATIRTNRRFRNSRFTMDISLKTGVPRVEFVLRIEWLERGGPDYGVPMLKIRFPLALEEGKPLFEIPFGHIQRPANGEEVPALRWVDLSGKRPGGQGKVGVTLVNDCKYGHSVRGDEIKLTLLRSSYDPDPLPELGNHEIRFALVPHGEDWGPSDATKAGCEFNHLPEVIATDVHKGVLPKERGFLSVSPSNVLLSGVKKAEDDDGLIIRLYETEGRQTEARVHFDPSLVKPDSSAVEVDLLERVISERTAKMEGEILKVMVPAFGITSVKIG